MRDCAFLPVTNSDMRSRGWDAVDVLLVSGDAYVDHPAFGAALIGRTLENAGYRVGLLAQPDWRTPGDFLRFGRPRLFVGITAGCLDSMVAHYAPNLFPRRRDACSPGGKAGLRPDRATVVYANRVREALPGVPIVLGGIEASLRRLAHYDYWSDSVRRSLLLDARADAIAYGMAETTVLEIAELLASGRDTNALHRVNGTVWVTPDRSELPPDPIEIPSFEAVAENRQAFLEAFRTWHIARMPGHDRPVVQRSANRFVVEMPPPGHDTALFDRVSELPFLRRAHPQYGKSGGVPALKTVETSVTAHRGCGGACSFCTLAVHQGRQILSRSPQSVLEEVRRIAAAPGFRGTITDIGGPTANMYGTRCSRSGECRRLSCLYPSPCANFRFDGRHHLGLLSDAARVPGVRHVFVGTGVRHDLILADPCRDYLGEICSRHVGGHLKVAPEHVCRPVLSRMHKPPRETFDEFRSRFASQARRSGRELYLVPYFMSGHPGCTTEHMMELAEYLSSLGHFAEQVQDFIPLPMTPASCMYWTGRDPFTGAEVFVPRGREKTVQRSLLQTSDPRNRKRLFPLLKRKGKLHLLNSPAGRRTAAHPQESDPDAC